MAVRFRQALVPLVAIALLAGCGQSVPVKATYYFPKARTSIVVTETLSCTQSGVLMTGLVVNPTTEYIRNDDAYATIDEKEFGGTFSDPDVAITYTGDGRLLGINASTAGEGPAIVKGVLSAVAVVANLQSPLGKVVGKPPAPPSLCDRIKSLTAKAPPAPPAKHKVKGKAATDKPANEADDKKDDPAISLVYVVNFQYHLKGQQVLLRDDPDGLTGEGQPDLTIKPAPESRSLYDQLDLANEPHSSITVSVESTQRQPKSRFTSGDSVSPDNNGDPDNKTMKGSHPSNFINLAVNKAISARLVVKGPDGGMKTNDDIWRGDVSVPIDEYDNVLVPKGGAFGTHGFSATFAADGQLNMIRYSSSGEAAQTLGAVNDALGALPKKKDKETAAQRADDIHDANRLRVCLADPTNCPGN